MLRDLVKPVLALVLALLVSLVGVAVQQPQQAAADDWHPYTHPGQREFNGRMWNTTCQAYSITTRCRAEIWATQVEVVDGKYQFVNGWVFNNLTYLASNGARWKGNPLAEDGQFTQDGRVWKTECFTEWTGDNGCRSFIYATVIEPTKGASGWEFKQVDKWLFNNVVQFTPGTAPRPWLHGNPCNAPAPAGFTFTEDGRPHVINTPYQPNHYYNPISLANFMKLAMRQTTTGLSDADRLCFALLGAEHLLDGAKTYTYQGKQSLWFPYPFGFSANPSIKDLNKNWYSGLGQAGAMTAFVELARFTGDDSWYDVAAKIFESYMVPMGTDGYGFTNRQNGFLWFEEYPTNPPTVVFNGHFQAVLALDVWAKHSNDPRARALFKEAIAGLKIEAPKMIVPFDGGTMSSYDSVRGYAPTPVRAVAVAPDPTPTPTPSPTPSPTTTPEPTASPTATASPTPGESPTVTTSPTATASPSATATAATANSSPTTSEEPTTDDEPMAASAAKAAPTARITKALLNGKPLKNVDGNEQIMPLGTSRAPSPNRLVNPKFQDVSPKDGRPDGWTVINPGRGGTILNGDWLGARPQGSVNGWAGVEQTIPAGRFPAGATLSLSFNSRLEITGSNPGTAGKVPVYSICPAPGGKTESKLLYENAKNRTKESTWSTTSFKAPAANCAIKVQLLTYSYSTTNTTAWYSNVQLRLADELSYHADVAYDLLVHRTPENLLTLQGSGSVQLEAYDGGRWVPVGEELDLTNGANIQIPERFTGRNININYHDGHVSELQRIACYSGERMFDDIAKELSSMSATVRYNPDNMSGRNCESSPITIDHNGQSIEIAAEPIPLDEELVLSPMSMDVETETSRPLEE